MKGKILILLLILLPALPLVARIEPSGTYLYAQKDGEDLCLDIYEPIDSAKIFVQIDSVTSVRKPTILFLFGGGFVQGSRDHAFYNPWFESLVAEGFRVVSIDYRLGLKGVGKMGIAQRDKLDRAIHLVVEDIFSCVLFLRENSSELGIDTDNLVLAGSSAGAISVLQADYELCNRTSYAANMPEGFRSQLEDATAQFMASDDMRSLVNVSALSDSIGEDSTAYVKLQLQFSDSTLEQIEVPLILMEDGWKMWAP